MGNALRLGIARVGLAINKWRTDRKQSKKQITILILGLQGTGKSTVALRLSKPRKSLPDSTYVQTKGFNTYEIRKKKLTIRLHDIGGHASIRELWTHYYADAHGIIYVVDSTKPDDLPEAGEVLAEVLRDERMRRKPVLLLANKQDDPNAVSEIELTRSMDLVTTVNSVRCLTRIDICAANNLKMDQGIFNGFKWLLSYIEIHYSELNERVKEESAIDMEREKALFNLRRSARDSTSPQPPIQANGSLANNNPRAASQEQYDDEDGIDQVQKPGELCSIDIDTDTGDHPARPKSITAILERQSPEGAPDSTKDLKNHSLDDKPSSLTTFPSPMPNLTNSTPQNNTSSQSMNASNLAFAAKPDRSETSISSASDNRKESSSAGLLKSAKRRNRVGPAVATTNSEIIEKPTPASDPLPKPVPGTLGVDNPAFEPNTDDQDSHIHLTNPPALKKLPISQIPVRTSAFSIRSNSTETDVDAPGEIIMVTTKAEVHKSQEVFDDINSNPTSTRPSSNIDKSVTETFNFINPENTHEQNQSPTLSYLSGGHISHKTSLESINSDTQPPNYRIDQPLTTPKSSNHRTTNNNNNHNYNNKPLPRSSSASHLNESILFQAQASTILITSQPSQHQQFTPLQQKFSSNQKHPTNKAPSSASNEHPNGTLQSPIPTQQSNNGIAAKTSNR